MVLTTTKLKTGKTNGIALKKKESPVAATMPNRPPPGPVPKRLRPVYDNVVVRPDNPETMTAGGIILPDDAQDKPVTGRVVAVGGGHLLNDGTWVPAEVKADDHIIYRNYAQVVFKHLGIDLIMIRLKDIITVMEY